MKAQWLYHRCTTPSRGTHRLPLYTQWKPEDLDISGYKAVPQAQEWLKARGARPFVTFFGIGLPDINVWNRYVDDLTALTKAIGVRLPALITMCEAEIVGRFQRLTRTALEYARRDYIRDQESQAKTFFATYRERYVIGLRFGIVGEVPEFLSFEAFTRSLETALVPVAQPTS